MQHLIKTQSAVCCTIRSNISISNLNILDCICWESIILCNNFQKSEKQNILVGFFFFFFSSDMECLSLAARLYRYTEKKLQRNPPQKAEITLGNSYQYLFTGMFPEAKVWFGLFSFERFEAWTGFSQLCLLLAGEGCCAVVLSGPPDSPDPAAATKGSPAPSYLCLSLLQAVRGASPKQGSASANAGGVCWGGGQLLALQGATTQVPLCREGESPELQGRACSPEKGMSFHWGLCQLYSIIRHSLNPALDVCYFILRRINMRPYKASMAASRLSCASPALCLKSWPNVFCSLL